MNQKVLATTYAKKNLSNLPEEIRNEFFQKFKDFHQTAVKDNSTSLSSCNKNEIPIYSLDIGKYSAILTIHGKITLVHAVQEINSEKP
ncbi:hypothetical protein F1737_08050 [Methanoplanus sp. FWC-SCC4]|uniref:Uncharacterized protein n=1 Tax=Methanochimaera problematica TaxID=2609417 RepID=A0AA97FEM7_9EURY|nr:hypothetical protein [Methanoplanus sp. FWC-SCC4]WOF16643.1 hypothetical protein F1737_08050 [Methanoplanus sp. FWC-SCC4]